MMPAKNFPIFHIFCSILFAAITSADPWRYSCNLTPTWSTPNNSTTIFRDNLNSLLSTLSSNAKNQNGFFNSTSDHDTTDTAYGLFICRGDVTADICKKCVTNATKDIVKLCPFQKEAAVCYDYCMLRYSDKNIFGTWYQYFVIDSSDDRHNVSEPQRFHKVLANLVNELKTRVANDDRKDKKFATQEANFTHGQKVLLNSIIISSKNLIMFSKQVLLAAKSKGDINERSNAKPLHYNFGAIQDATNNFSFGHRIGRGGFGDVYKGKLPNGQEIAVKRLSQSSIQGAEEFQSEVLLIAKLQHRNLVKLLGFCLQGVERILIYEFVPNRSLDYYLFDAERQRTLNWAVRLMIIRGIARGLLYLHEDCPLKIVHRDLKPNNILLDAEMNPKISDFGMSRIFGADQTQGNTKRVAGTYGYMSPEYVMYGQYSIKSDVFSFGVLTLEIVTGKKNSSFYESNEANDLPSYAWKHWKENTPLELIDSILKESYSRNELLRCIQIGLLCVQKDAHRRPTMGSVVLMLSSNSVTLPIPQRPAFFASSKTEIRPKEFSFDEYSSSMYIDEASVTKTMTNDI